MTHSHRGPELRPPVRAWDLRELNAEQRMQLVLRSSVNCYPCPRTIVLPMCLDRIQQPANTYEGVYATAWPCNGRELSQVPGWPPLPHWELFLGRPTVIKRQTTPRRGFFGFCSRGVRPGVVDFPSRAMTRFPLGSWAFVDAVDTSVQSTVARLVPSCPRQAAGSPAPRP
jgi:hypothetical protein